MSKCNLHIDKINLSFGNYTALNDIDITAESHSFISIVGPNGGGKTTLLKLILGLLKPTSGKITINSKEISENSNDLIGYVPQIKTLDRTFPARSIELVASGLTNQWTKRIPLDMKEQIFEALGKVGAEHLAYRQLSKLSGGELQRIYLSRSFIRKPKILLLDEPVTGIDQVGENDIHNIIEQYREETDSIILMVTHDWEAAYHHADKVLLLNRKQICFDEPKIAFSEHHLRKAFSHEGHEHDIVFGVKHHD